MRIAMGVAALCLLAWACGTSNDDGRQGGSGGSGAIGGGGGSGGTGGTGGSGGSGGEGGSGGDGGTEASPFFRELAEKLQALHDGEAVDLDGDGVAETRLETNGDGTTTWTETVGGRLVYLAVFDDATGSWTASTDANQDGIAERYVEVTIDAETQTRLEVVDLDEDGYPDKRFTWVSSRENPDRMRYVEETADASGHWQVVAEMDQMKTRHAGGSCEGMDHFPSEGNEEPLFAGGAVTMIGGDFAGACNLGDAQKVRDAVECALDRGLKCLKDTNTANANALKQALAGKGVMPLDIGCGNVCTGAVAATRSWGRPWFTNSRINVNTAEFSRLDAEGRCSIMLHELLHWAGNEGASHHNDRSGPGSDDVYSCGRYCGGCSNAAHGAPGNSAVDCARCADTKARREQCGSRVELEELDCEGQLTGICHAGLACLAGACQTCGGPVIYDCDGNVLEKAVSCCLECPDNCDHENDAACQGSISGDTCLPNTPPHCP